MKNLGHFNEESIARFSEHFEDNIEFSESTEDYLDFARCQRANGTIYGTSGQCRKGSPIGAKEKEETKGRSSKAKSKQEDRSVIYPSPGENLTRLGRDMGSTPADRARFERIQRQNAAADKLQAQRDAALAKENKASTQTKAPEKKASTKSAATDIKAKRAEVREMDKQAKDLDRQATRLDKAFPEAN